MKVIDGGFGADKDDRKPMEILRDHINKSGLDELEQGEFLLLMDTGAAMVMLSNFTAPEQVLMMCEKGKTAIMMTQFGAPEGGPDAS